jgi:hypothetical protein
MQNNRSVDEIRVYAGIAERTGVRFDRKDVRRSAGFCRSLQALVRNVRSIGDGTFYLPVDVWPGNSDRFDVYKPWVVMTHGAETITPILHPCSPLPPPPDIPKEAD